MSINMTSEVETLNTSSKVDFGIESTSEVTLTDAKIVYKPVSFVDEDFRSLWADTEFYLLKYD